MNIEDNVQSLTVTSSLTSSTLYKIFSGVISDDLSISDVKMNLDFQNGRHFEFRASFSTGCSTRS